MDNTAVKTSRRMDTKRMTVLAMFVALGYLCMFVFRFKVQFLTFDIKDVFITICGFIFGPLTAVGVALTEALLEMATLSDTGFWGAIMNFAGSAAFAGTASLIYKHKKTLWGAVAGLASAAVVMTGVMLVMNILITPIYMHCPRSVVYGIIPSLLLPFNLVKGIMNAGFVFLLYKPLTGALRSARVLPAQKDFKVTKKSFVIMIIATLVVAAAFIVLFAVLKGNIQWVRK